MLALAVDLLLFAGRCTARDVCRASVSPAGLGIPPGSRSTLQSMPPARRVGGLAALYLQGRVTSQREAEVMDVVRTPSGGVSSPQLYGYYWSGFSATCSRRLAMLRGP